MVSRCGMDNWVVGQVVVVDAISKQSLTSDSSEEPTYVVVEWLSREECLETRLELQSELREFKRR